MKKLLSIVLACVMAVSLLCVVPASATELPANIATDYQPDESTRYSDNMLTGEYSNMYTGCIKNIGLHTNGVDRYMTASDTVAVSLPLGGKYGHALGGYRAEVSAPASATGRVVFRYNIRKTIGTPIVSVARLNTAVTSDTNPDRVEFPMEYSNNNAGLEAQSDYKILKGTFKDTGSASEKYKYYFGFVNGTALSSQFFSKIADEYIAYERAFDMSVTAEDNKLYQDKTITINATVLNQIENPFGGENGVTWYALNSDRTAVVEGFTIADNGSGEYAVSIDETVENGTYSLVAVANADENIVKGISIEVSDNPYLDYVANEETKYSDNILTGVYSNRYIGSVKNCGIQGNSRYMSSSDTAAVELPLNGKYSYPVAGYKAETNAPEDAVGRVVFYYSIKKTAGTPVVNVARTNETITNEANPARAEFPIDSDCNKGLAPDTNYQVLKGTFADTGAASAKYVYHLGFVNGTALSSQFFSEIDKEYIAYERPYDISVTADSTVWTKDTTEAIGVSASLINQIDNPYGGAETITWKAMNTARTAQIDGITITAGENNTATVAVADEVPAGTYDIVAVVGDAIMAKGVSITVKNNPYADFVPGDVTGNVIQGALTANYNYNHSSLMLVGETSTMGDVWFGYDSANGAYSCLSYRVLPDPNAVFVKNEETGYHEWDGETYSYNHPFSGGSISTNCLDWGSATGTKANVVFAIKVKGISGYELPLINVGRSDNGKEGTDATRLEYPVEYDEKTKGFTPSGTTDWEYVTGTFLDNDRIANNYAYVIGFAQGTEKNAAAFISNEDAYLGIEYAYDLAVEAAADSVAAGSSVAVSAAVLNQVGREFRGEKEAITWKAMNTERTEFVDGITINDGVALVDASVEPGTYDIVAVYGDFVMTKGVTIEVTEAEDAPVIEDITITATAGGITVATDEDLTDAKLIFVTYDTNGKMTALDCTTTVTLAAQGTQEYPVPAGFESAKVMLWSEMSTTCTPLADFIS